MTRFASRRITVLEWSIVLLKERLNSNFSKIYIKIYKNII